MQSGGQVKKLGEYFIGERVREDGYCAGRVVAVAAHPARRSVGYLLLVNSRDEYTIYRGMADARCGLALARNIPEGVAMQFAGVIQGGDPPPNPFGDGSGRKFPVVSEPEPEPEHETGPPEPYFDFV